MKYPLLIKNDPWLEPFAETIMRRQEQAAQKKETLTRKGSLSDFATGYLYFGLHRTDDGWVIREWAPHASMIYLMGTFNDWKIDESYEFVPLAHGVWELRLPPGKLHHGDLYALMMHWPGDRENGFPPGPSGLSRTRRRIFLTPRCGLRKTPTFGSTLLSAVNRNPL